MPVGKIKSCAGPDYSAGSVNIESQTKQSGALANKSMEYGKGVGGTSSYGAGAKELEEKQKAQKLASDAKAV
eukprot:m.305990 g.305990  ORF g.305990 m.305990 type:complete len:72 (+) comp40881_c0_seq1:124-339(+)